MVTEKNNLIGAALCGGQSTRMGNDKGLIITGGLTWGEIAYYKISVLGIPVFISINENQKSDYTKVFLSKMLVVDSNNINVQGPLKGLLSLHNLFPEKDIMVLACDMMGMRTIVLQKLKQFYITEKNNYEVFIYKQENYVESVAAIYSASFLTKIFELYKKGNLNKYSLQYVVNKNKALEIPVSEEEKQCFMNCNYPADVNEHF